MSVKIGTQEAWGPGSLTSMSVLNRQCAKLIVWGCFPPAINTWCKNDENTEMQCNRPHCAQPAKWPPVYSFTMNAEQSWENSWDKLIQKCVALNIAFFFFFQKSSLSSHSWQPWFLKGDVMTSFADVVELLNLHKILVTNLSRKLATKRTMMIILCPASTVTNHAQLRRMLQQSQ